MRLPSDSGLNMGKLFKRGDHVEWNSEAGSACGTIIKCVLSDIRFKGYVHHASRDEPQYLKATIESDQKEKLARSDEAFDAIKQRRLRLIRPGSCGGRRIKAAQESLTVLKAECCKESSSN